MSATERTTPRAETPPPVHFESRLVRGRPRQVLRFTLKSLLRLLIGLRIEGIERVPARGPLLVVANHLHNADPVLVEVAIPRPLHYMAKKELFAVPVLGWLLRQVGCFPVDRGKADRSAIRNAQLRLDRGVAVGMFPEGTRSVTRALKVALPGAAAIAQLTGTPVLPVAITGSERLPLNGAKGRARADLPRPNPGHRGVRVHFGRPFTIPHEIDGRRLSREEATEYLMREIVRLLPPDYRGVYAHLVDEV